MIKKKSKRKDLSNEPNLSQREEKVVAWLKARTSEERDNFHKFFVELRGVLPKLPVDWGFPSDGDYILALFPLNIDPHVISSVSWIAGHYGVQLIAKYEKKFITRGAEHSDAHVVAAGDDAVHLYAEGLLAEIQNGDGSNRVSC